MKLKMIAIIACAFILPAAFADSEGPFDPNDDGTKVSCEIHCDGSLQGRSGQEISNSQAVAFCQMLGKRLTNLSCQKIDHRYGR